jgi:hypothetical protein
MQLWRVATHNQRVFILQSPAERVYSSIGFARRVPVIRAGLTHLDRTGLCGTCSHTCDAESQGMDMHRQDSGNVESTVLPS